MPNTWDNIATEVNSIVESIKHFAGVEGVTLLVHEERDNLFKILVQYRNRKQLSILVQNKPTFHGERNVWRKIGEDHLGQ